MKTKTVKKPATARPQTALEAQFEPVVRVFHSDTKVTQARMFGSPGLKINGKVFAMLVKGKLVVKLPKERVDALVASGDGQHFDPGHGRLMKEWVAIAPVTKEKWLSLAKEARDFVGSGR